MFTIQNIPLEKTTIENAQRLHNWTPGNEILYDLCVKYPSQSKPEEIVSKFWLIGRAYSAALERRRTSKEKPEEGYIYDRLVREYKKASLDTRFDSLPKQIPITEHNADGTMKVHNLVTTVLNDVSGQWKRSLASKYLHFHFPLLYFIFDKRAENRLAHFVPSWWKRELPENKEYDMHYYRFTLAMIALRDAIESEHQIELTPRELDQLLLA